MQSAWRLWQTRTDLTVRSIPASDTDYWLGNTFDSQIWSESPRYSRVRYWLLTWEYSRLSDLIGSLQIWSDLLPVTSVTLSGCRPWYNSQWSFCLPVGPWSRCVPVHALTSSFTKSLNTQHWHSASCQTVVRPVAVSYHFNSLPAPQYK